MVYHLPCQWLWKCCRVPPFHASLIGNLVMKRQTWGAIWGPYFQTEPYLATPWISQVNNAFKSPASSDPKASARRGPGCWGLPCWRAASSWDSCPSILMGISGSYIGLTYGRYLQFRILNSHWVSERIWTVCNHVIWRVEPRWCFCQDFETEVDQQLSKGAKFYELPLSVWDDVQTVGLKSHYAPQLHRAMMTLTESSGTI